MVCHRGANLIAPEDSLAAVRAAFELGAGFVEIDERNSVDHIPFLMHDRRFERTADVDRHYSRGRATPQHLAARRFVFRWNSACGGQSPPGASRR